MTTGYTFTVEKECPICHKKIHVTRTRSRLIKLSQDSDFCIHYKDFNPYYYAVWVCTYCGYAAEEKYFENLTEVNQNKISEFLAEKKIGIQYKGTRTRDDAIAAFKLAIYFANLINAPASRMGSLYLKLAWLYREACEEENEKKTLRWALESYEKALTMERFPIGAMTDFAVTYLIGNLHWRLGNVEKATQCLSRVIGDRRARMEPVVHRMARDLWQEIRREHTIENE